MQDVEALVSQAHQEAVQAQQEKEAIVKSIGVSSCSPADEVADFLTLALTCWTLCDASGSVQQIGD